MLETPGISVSFLRKPSTTPPTSASSLARSSLKWSAVRPMSVALLLQDVEQPVRQLDVAVAGALGLAQRLDEGFVADPVELAGDGFEADVGHGRLPIASSFSGAACASCAQRVRPDGSARRSASVRSAAAQFGAIQLVQPSCPDVPSLHRLDLAGRQRQLDIPVELIAEIEEDRIGQRLAAVPSAGSARYSRHVLRDRCGCGSCPATLKTLPPTQRVDAERAVLRPSARAVGRVERQPHADELLDLDLDAEQAGEEAAQPRGGFRLRRRSARQRRACSDRAPRRGRG